MSDEIGVCNYCDSDLNCGACTVDFEDIDTGAVLSVELNAEWCPGCGYQRITRG